MAEIQPFTVEEIKEHVPDNLRKSIGTLDDLRAPGASFADGKPVRVGKHAALLWVDYAQAGHPRSVILYVKAAMTGDEPEDVMNYQVTHPEFPHEPTADQFFDESQWESYRKLGLHATSELFASDWFWRLIFHHRKELGHVRRCG